MSKKELKVYLKSLKKAQLETQIIDLYERFKDVKVFYDFAFNPKEDDLLETGKAKILKEYFPQTRRRPKARRSVAQNLIKHFMTLGMDPAKIAELMLFNLETAQEYVKIWRPGQQGFYKSMYQSFAQAKNHMAYHKLTLVFAERLEQIALTTDTQYWYNADHFQQ